MSQLLWKYYLEDDVDRFRHLLETAAYNVRSTAQKGGGTSQNIAATTNAIQPATSPGAHAGSSPLLSAKGRKASFNPPSSGGVSVPGHASITLTRTDINWRDSNGMTILHHSASSTSDNAFGFAQALLEHPLVDLYLQDLENGWTPLHRAFYFGNITIARAILERDADNALGRALGGRTHNVLGLIKIKDREGLGPLDLYAATIQDRTLHPDTPRRTRADSNAGSEPEEADDVQNPDSIGRDVGGGDECYTFGTNRNITLGFGDEDDRQWPERITLRRPEHLLQRFYREHMENQVRTDSLVESTHLDAALANSQQSVPLDSMPWIVRARPVKIRDVRMSKLHTAVLTDDPEANLHVCGHGPGGRLGLGHEKTQFTFACVEGGALAGKRVVSVALGQNHTLAVSDAGELFSWGSNSFGQLGYSLPRTGANDEEPLQSVPRQIFGSVKREVIQGIAASRIHSVAFVGSSLYTWGKNDGQLGLVDSDARSLGLQTTPRKVAASLFSTAILAVSAIDRATICLLSGSHDCFVFANYGYTKVQFPLDSFSNYFLSSKSSQMWAPKVDSWGNHVVNITSGGDTICALSSHGEVYSLSVGQPHGAQAVGTSTTNPGKIKAALSIPQRIWSLKKNNMAARDVGVDADGSIIITTQEGSVWKRSRRAKIKDATASGTAEYKPKDYKFSRVSGLTRVVGVRASSYGAYAAIRRDCDVTKTQIVVETSNMWDDILQLLSFKDFMSEAVTPDSESENPEPRFWKAKVTDETVILKKHLLQAKDVEKELKDFFFGLSDPSTSGYDLVVSTSVSELRIPVHHTVLAARSRVLRERLSALFDTTETTDCDIFKFEPAKPVAVITFAGIDPLTLMNFVLYCYTDNLIDYWHYASRAPKLAHRYRTIRTEMMKLAGAFNMRKLEASVRQMISPAKCMAENFDAAYDDPVYFDNADILVELADDEIPVHSSIICQRCPFFEGLFMGRAQGRWLDARRDPTGAKPMVRVDLKHIESNIFKLVLRHIYADTGEELFDQIISADLEEFFDFLMDVLSVANELMLDRLAQICQTVMGRYVNIRNVCSLLNAVAPSAVSEFKDATLEYMCLSLEAMLHAGLLDELDDDLLLELDEVVRSNQLACLPFAKSGRAEALLLDNHPELAAIMERNRQAKIDAVTIHSKHQDVGNWASSSFRGHSLDEDLASPSQQKSRRRSKANAGAKQSPAMYGKEAVEKLGSTYDEAIDLDFNIGAPALSTSARNEQRQNPDLPVESPKPDVWFDSRGKALSPPTQSPLARSIKTFDHASPSLQAAPSPGPSPGMAPWGSSPALVKKLDLKDIMSQTSTNRVSNLSAGLAASRSKSDNVVVPGFGGTKMSQKERKKIQQQATQQDELSRRQSSALAESPGPSFGTPPAKGSPWQTVGALSKGPSLKDVMQGETKPVAESPASISRTPTTPQLTMRQTVAHTRPSNMTSKSQPIVSQSTARSVPKARPSAPKTTTPTTQTVSIQSVRHQPQPTSPIYNLSMADILSQQQEEKDSVARVREENAKRSLQDIQAEQEFQQWWDMEERRYKIENGLLTPDEDEEGAEGGDRTSKGAKSRGKNRGKGGTRKADSRPTGSSSRSQTQPAAASRDTDKPKRTRGDANGRPSRGRGRAVPSAEGRGTSTTARQQ
ncbi:hypothetical protein K461DRAFT_287921 [Myriangium duriaei CBS 260.36]|uniref:BTB domain-containing protein n=1 Tax=Myriangium duriaei CBS 260.36 TaxID=1168546 RepID=A0A9P4MDK2_9PEZI|nr:hypothetical protein K461DRAFT_287921 [Myriangium duriaei CBS 260.36]